MNILDDGDFESLAVARFDDDDRDLVQAGALRGAPPPLAGDDLIGVRDARNGARQNGLNDAALLDRGGEFVEFGLVEIPSRIARIGPQEFDRRLALAARALAGRGLLADVAEQRGEPAAEAGSGFRWTSGVIRHGLYLPVMSGGEGRLTPPANARSRWMTSEASFR